jgi:hypothetical protein
MTGGGHNISTLPNDNHPLTRLRTVCTAYTELLDLLGKVGPSHEANDGLLAECLEGRQDFRGCGLQVTKDTSGR